jgi:hypothetical protein
MNPEARRTIIAPDHWYFLDDLTNDEFTDRDGTLESITIRVEAETKTLKVIDKQVPASICTGQVIFRQKEKFVDSIDCKTIKLNLVNENSLGELKTWLNEEYPGRKWYVIKLVVMNGYDQRLVWERHKATAKIMRICLESVDGKLFYEMTYQEKQSAAGEFQEDACYINPGNSNRAPVCEPVARMELRDTVDGMPIEDGVSPDDLN